MPSSSLILSLAAALPAVLAAPSYGNVPGNYSQPIVYSVPSYKSSVSVPVYDVPKSTPCSSSVKTSSTPSNGYGSYPPASSPNNYGSYPPASTPNNNGYGSYPPVSIPGYNNNGYGSYPVTSSKPSYGDNYKTPSSKTTITTTYTTTYVDVCETGYITKTSTWAITYCPPTGTPTPGQPKKTPTNYGWDYQTKVCQKGCGEGPKTVTVTVPCKNCNYATPTPPVQSKPVCNGKDCIYSTTKVYSTKVITVTKTPTPNVPKSTPIQSKPFTKPIVSSKPFTPVVYTPVSSPASKPVIPASSPAISKPSVPTPPPSKNNNTMSIGTGVKPTPSKTGYVPPAQFTGAAAGVQAGGFVAVVAVAAAMFL